jgi:hypothetical protein
MKKMEEINANIIHNYCFKSNTTTQLTTQQQQHNNNNTTILFASPEKQPYYQGVL